MSQIKAFKAIRPAAGKSAAVASLPYDVMNRTEAKEMVRGKKDSFLHVVRAEVDLPDSVDIHADEVYAKSRENLDKMLKEGVLIQDERPLLYIYRQVMDGRAQTGLVACASVDEYMDGRIKKHELTLEAKEQDRIRHFDTCDANTAPIFLSYRASAEVDKLIADYIAAHKPNADFTSEDGIQHITWVIEDEKVVEAIIAAFKKVEALYIADGHHRCASSAKVGAKRRQQYPDAPPEAEFNWFLAVIFPDKDLHIFDYNRVVKDLNGLSKEDFLARVREHFELSEADPAKCPYRPEKKGEYGMFLEGKWYVLRAKKDIAEVTDPVERLDVQILQKYLLGPILGIKDPRTDERIDFVGGIRGLKELEKRVNSDMKVAFSMYPTAMSELLAVADAGKIMPPKSTWFEPKLRSGLFVHKLSD